MLIKPRRNRSIVGNSLSQKDVKSVKFLGVTNQIVDWKLHAFLNFQENLQANVYSFFVTYTDGTSETVQTYDEDEVAELMEFAERSNSATATSARNNGTDITSVLEQLDKLTSLYDNGVIDDKTYAYQKNKLVLQLQEPEQEIIEDNLTVRRKHKRRMGDAKIYLYIDGKKECEVEDPVILTLPKGEYTIQFRVSALKTPLRKIIIKSAEDKYSFVVDHQVFRLIDTMYRSE